MILNQKYSFTGSTDYNFNNIGIPTNGIALFDTRSGIGGIDYMPANGDTVTVVAGYTTSTTKGDTKRFATEFNNVIYYLVSNIQYNANDRDEIISLGTPITLVFNPGLGGYYSGTFVFSNPNDFQYLYLVYDYTDNLDLGVITYTGSFTERIVDVDFGSNRGSAGIDYVTTNRPVRYQLYWNNYLIKDTGYIGLNSTANYNGLTALGIDPADINLVFPLNGLVNNGTGSIRFNKFIDLADANLILSAPRSTTSFQVTRVNPTLTDFWMAPTASTLSAVCGLIPNVKYRHDGSSALPTIGDRIYVDSAGTTLVDGGNSYFQISLTSLVVPPVTGGLWITIDSNGVVTSEGGCDCSEIAIPVITPQGFVFTTNQNINVQIEATNNPTSWEIITSCEEYTLDGGTTGTIFTVDDCKYGTQTVTVSIGETSIVCSATAPTVVGGDGSVTLNGACASFVLPNGLSFDIGSGILSGVVSDECDFTFDVEATNCFGTSVTETITISIVASSKFKPFLMDVENFGTTSANACAIASPLYSVLYHNGVGDLPTTGDLILRVYDAQGNATPFFGGGMWYVAYNSADVLKICETGKVCDVYTCP